VCALPCLAEAFASGPSASGPSASEPAARFALSVGSNRGHDTAGTLRYAERDAERFAEILTDLGGFLPSNVRVLKSPTLKEMLGGLDNLNRQIEAARKKGGPKALAVVYFSGHADGVHLELGKEQLAFSTLKSKLEQLSADVKILFVDSCQSGGLTAYKGGRPGPAFDIVFSDTIDANGTAILTSSAAGEKSQESSRLEGSFFTHYLISGLLGTADFDQDRRVTLNEIYQYSYNKTVAETSETMGGIQHPTYDYRMTGRGKVVLTDLTLGVSQLEFGPDMSGTYLILKEETNEIVAEVNKQRNTKRTVAVPSDTYCVATRREGKVYSKTVKVEQGKQLHLMDSELVSTPKLEKVFEKGKKEETGRTVGLSVSYGMLSGALKRYSALHEGIVALRLDIGPLTLFPKASIGMTDIDEDGFQYRLLLITGEGGIAWRFEKSALDLFLGLNLGAGYGRQTLEGGLMIGTMFIYTLLGGLELPFSNHFVLSIFWEVGSHVYRAEEKMSQFLLLRGSLGVGVHF
jgi:hypothetical protein